MDARVADNADERRYELRLDGRLVGRIDYVASDGVLALTHAEVDRELRNRGLGELLVRDALADVRARGLRVRPLCPFVAAYVRRHPEVGDLVA